MYPHERSLVRRMADKPFAIIGINSDSDLSKIRQIVKDKAITWRSFWNGTEGARGPISEKWCVQGWPTTYLLDKDGVIRYSNLNGDKLDEAIEKLMAEMGEEVKLVGIDHETEGAVAPVEETEEPAPKEETEKKSDAQTKPNGPNQAKG